MDGILVGFFDGFKVVGENEGKDDVGEIVGSQDGTDVVDSVGCAEGA